MKVYLAGSGWEFLWDDRKFYNFYRLESFFYISKREKPLIGMYKSFLFDSGAFTFMNNNKSKPNWDEYVENYGKFIKDNNVKYFFELDIDSIVGIIEVERLRAKLEKIAGRKCIPVWHKSRGLEYWKKMVKEYNYVAIGGLVTKEIKRSEYGIFNILLKEAHRSSCLVHGLGFTNLEGVKKYKFDSVDSTSWLSGNRFGHVYQFKNGNMLKQNKKKGQRVKTQEVALNNFQQWVKFQKYADIKL